MPEEELVDNKEKTQVVAPLSVLHPSGGPLADGDVTRRRWLVLSILQRGSGWLNRATPSA